MKTPKIALLTWGLGLIGYLLWVAPADPDVLFTQIQVLGTLFLTLFFIFCCYSWGGFLAVRLGRVHLRSSTLGTFSFAATLAISLALGSAAAAVVMMLAGHLGIIGRSWDKFWIVLLALGPILQVQFARPSLKKIGKFPKDGFSRAAFGLLLAVVLTETAIALLAHGTSDPFLYHLVGPRFWWSMGKVMLPPHLPIVYQCSWWEYLLIWGNVIFAEYPAKGLIEAHLFGQIIHVLVGMGGTSLALLCLVEKIFPSFKSKSIAPIAVLAGVSSLSLWATVCLAKNDFGACFWSLMALVFLFEDRLGTSRRFFWAGCFAGLGIATKWNNGLFMLPTMAAFMGVSHFREKRSCSATLKWILLTTVGGVLLTAPILIRNWIAVGNPFFPFLNEVFGNSSNLGGATRSQLSTIGQSPAVGTWLPRLFSLLMDEPLSFGLLLAPFVLFFSGATPEIIAIFIGLAATLGFFTFVEVRDFMPRWLGSALILAPVMGFAFAYQSLSRLPKLGSKFLPPILIVLASILLVDFHLEDWSTFKNVFSGTSPSYVIINETVHLGGASKAWLRIHADPSDLIITTGDNEIYYLSDYNVVPMTEAPEISDQIRELRTPLEVLDTLWRTGGKFVLDTQHFDSLFWSGGAQMLASLVSLHRETVLFETGRSRVIDLHALREAVAQACLPRQAPTKF